MNINEYVERLFLFGDSVFYVDGHSNSMQHYDFCFAVGISGNTDTFKIDRPFFGISRYNGIIHLYNDTVYITSHLLSKDRQLFIEYFILGDTLKYFAPSNRRFNYSESTDLGLYRKCDVLFKVTAEGKLNKYWYDIEDSLYLDYLIRNNRCPVVDDIYKCEPKIYGRFPASRKSFYAFQFANLLFDGSGFIYRDVSNCGDTSILFMKLPVNLGRLKYFQLVPCNSNYLLVNESSITTLLDKNGAVLGILPKRKGFYLIHNDTIRIAKYGKCCQNSGPFQEVSATKLKKYRISYGFQSGTRLLLLSKDKSVYEGQIEYNWK